MKKSANQIFYNFLLLLALLGTPLLLYCQTDPIPITCAGVEGASESNLNVLNCAHSSTLWSANSRHVPPTGAEKISLHANFIIIQKADGTGNFQDIPEHRAFLDEWLATCNLQLGSLWGTSNCSPLLHDAKVEIIPNWVFMPDPTEFYWNNDNIPGTSKCPGDNWNLAPLDAMFPPGINVYFTIDGSVYSQMVTLGTVNNPETAGMTYTWCSEQPRTNLSKQSRIHVPNLFLKYYWFKNFPETSGGPFSVTRSWLVGEGIGLAHEFGHSFITDYVHELNCTNHLMTADGGQRNVLRVSDVGNIHRNLARTNLRRFIDCGETYNTSLADREVTTNETWDLNMRCYSNIIVKTGSILTITCEILMPQEGTITVERGAKLIIDGGKVTRANTCSPSEFWRGIIAQGNASLPQPDPGGAIGSNQSGVVILKGDGMIEGAIIGVATKGHPQWDVPEFRGAVVDATDFTFQDCRKGVEFMKYDFPNRSKFTNVTFARTATGSMHTGVSIWDADAIVFKKCTFKNMIKNGIISADAVFNVKRENKFSGSEIAILSGGSMPLSGQIQVGELGLSGDTRNKFENNTVGIKATSNSKAEIYSNDFSDFDIDIAVNGITETDLIDNLFKGVAAGNQFDNTSDRKNTALCNIYSNNIVGTNIIGENTGYLFRQEDFATKYHDLFIEGTTTNPGTVQMSQGTSDGARWNYFSAGKAENIKTSTIDPNNVTETFFYFHPDPATNSRLEPKCAINSANCANGINSSNFFNVQTFGSPFSNCIFPEPPPGFVDCRTKPCLDAVRYNITQKTAQYTLQPTDDLKAELQRLVTNREYITDDLIRGYISTGDWAAVENLLNEDLTPANRRRLVGAKMQQQQFSGASTLLQSFPQATISDQYFVQTQNINLARLQTDGFTLTQEQESGLLNIAQSATSEAGYAQTLLQILTGRVFMPRLPDIGEERSAEPVSLQNGNVMLVTPNPVSDVLTVQLPDHLTKCELQLVEVATGKVVRHTSGHSSAQVFIPVQDLPSGIYLITLHSDGAPMQHTRVVVHH